MYHPEAAADDDEGLEAPEGAARVLAEGDGSLASEDEDNDDDAAAATAGLAQDGSGLTQEALRAVDAAGSGGGGIAGPTAAVEATPPDARTVGSSSSGPGSWLYGARGGSSGGAGGGASSRFETSSALDDDDASSVVSLGDWMAADAQPEPGAGGAHARGCFVTGRVNRCVRIVGTQLESQPRIYPPTKIISAPSHPPPQV